MSIPLTILARNLINLSVIEKSLLKDFAFQANGRNEFWCSIECMMLNTGASRKTIERALKQLRNKKFIIYTGKTKGNLHRTPIYRIDFSHGQFGGDQKLVTDNLSLSHGQNGGIGHGQNDHMESNKKDNKKDNGKIHQKMKKERYGEMKPLQEILGMLKT